MTNIKDIYILDINWINKEIEEVKYLISIRKSEFPQTSEDFSNLHKEILLETIKAQLKPIKLLIEESFRNGWADREKNKDEHPPYFHNDLSWGENGLNDYINTKQFEL